MNNLLTHMHLLWSSSTCFRRNMFCRTHTQNQVENTQNKIKSAKRNMNFRNAQRRMRSEAHLRNYLDRDTTIGGVQAQPRAHQSKAMVSGRTPAPPLRSTSLWRLHGGRLRPLLIVTIFVGTKPSYSHYISMARVLSFNTPHKSFSPSTCILLLFLV
jgi:hypothetical protein